VTPGKGKGRFADAGLVLGIGVFSAFFSGARTWTGFNSPDSEFYATLALYGREVADRSIDPAYTWTRLGYIAPVHGLTSLLGPWLGFAAWRFLLVLMVVGSIYAMARMASTRQVAVVAAVFASLNTVVLSFVGNTYLTGTALSALLLLLALGLWGSLHTPARAWLPPLLSGAVLGWLAMVNPYAMLLGLTMWLGLRIQRVVSVSSDRWRSVLRDALAGGAGFIATFGTFLLLGLAIFPGRNWFQTYLEWNSKLDYSTFVGDAASWQHDLAMLVPVVAVGLALVAVIATQANRWSVAALVIVASSLLFTAVYMLLVPGPWLEAPTYLAFLWPASLAAIALSFAAIVGGRSLGWIGWLTAAAVLPMVVWAGHWDADVSVEQGVLLSIALVALSAGAAWGCGRGPAALGAVLVVIAIGAVAIGAQVLQNGRGLVGSYGQFPFRAAFVDFDTELLMHSKVAAQDFVLGQTTPDDRIAIWTDPDRLTAGIAAMQLWGWYNNVLAGATMSPTEAEELTRQRPTALAMYAPEEQQIRDFWASLPPKAHPTAPQCTSVPFLGIGPPEAHVCVAHLAWG
jgi:hypothetical protein